MALVLCKVLPVIEFHNLNYVLNFESKTNRRHKFINMLYEMYSISNFKLVIILHS